MGNQLEGRERTGSAKDMIGSIYTLYCFVSGGNDEWTTKEKQEMSEKLHESQKWLEKQGRLYNVDVNFDQRGQYGFKEDIKLPELIREAYSDKKRVDWVAKALYMIGYTDTKQFVQWVNENTSCKNIQVLVLVKGSGNSYALPYRVGDNEQYFLEGGVVFESFSNGSKIASSSIALLTLQLYGAWNFYGNPEVKKKAQETFPDSIMLRTSYSIDTLDIDEITAWRIGWNREPKGWYETYQPHKPKKFRTSKSSSTTHKTKKTTKTEKKKEATPIMLECPNCNGIGLVRPVVDQERRCDSCDGLVGDEAKSCIHCGHPNYDWETGRYGKGTYLMSYYGDPIDCSTCFGTGKISETKAADLKSDKTGCLTGLFLYIPIFIFGLEFFWFSTGRGFLAGLTAIALASTVSLFIPFIVGFFISRIEDPISRLNTQRKVVIVFWVLLFLQFFIMIL